MKSMEHGSSRRAPRQRNRGKSLLCLAELSFLFTYFLLQSSCFKAHFADQVHTSPTRLSPIEVKVEDPPTVRNLFFFAQKPHYLHFISIFYSDSNFRCYFLGLFVFRPLLGSFDAEKPPNKQEILLCYLYIHIFQPAVPAGTSHSPFCEHNRVKR